MDTVKSRSYALVGVDRHRARRFGSATRSAPTGETFICGWCRGQRDLSATGKARSAGLSAVNTSRIAGNSSTAGDLNCKLNRTTRKAGTASSASASIENDKGQRTKREGEESKLQKRHKWHTRSSCCRSWMGGKPSGLPILPGMKECCEEQQNYEQTTGTDETASALTKLI